MKYVSTGGKSPEVPFSIAVQLGLAPDGGLYVPEGFPESMGLKLESNIGDLCEFATALLQPFLEGDLLQGRLPEFSKNAFNFPIPLTPFPTENTQIMELFHGPTAAFKDVGARFLAECLNALVDKGEKKTVLVATSGDTGGAVASAFHGKDQIQVGVFFPKGRVSPFQEKQLTCWGGNIQSFRVNGNFDDCQRLVKEAFSDVEFVQRVGCTSANSINVGRLLPQMIYYGFHGLSSLTISGKPLNLIIPTGNLGNAQAALWAREMGLGIGKIVLATNGNSTLIDYQKTGVYKSRPSIPTLANAMDVGDPSNFQRLRTLYPSHGSFLKDLQVFSVSDDQILGILKKHGDYPICPHTATALYVREVELDPSENWVVIATAHPAKFLESTQECYTVPVPIPVSLQTVLAQPTSVQDMDPDLETLETYF